MSLRTPRPDSLPAADGGYNNGDNEPYTQFVFELLSLGDADLPWVVSMSYR